MANSVAVLDGGTGFLKAGYAGQVRNTTEMSDRMLLTLAARTFQTTNTRRSSDDQYCEQKSRRQVTFS